MFSVRCNVAILDNKALNTALEQSRGDIDEAVRLFNTLRYHDVQKTQELQEVQQQRCVPSQTSAHTCVSSEYTRSRPTAASFSAVVATDWHHPSGTPRSGQSSSSKAHSAAHISEICERGCFTSESSIGAQKRWSHHPKCLSSLHCLLVTTVPAGIFIASILLLVRKHIMHTVRYVLSKHVIL